MGEHRANADRIDWRRNSLTDLISKNPGFGLNNGSSPQLILHRHQSWEQREKEREGGRERENGRVRGREGKGVTEREASVVNST